MESTMTHGNTQDNTYMANENITNGNTHMTNGNTQGNTQGNTHMTNGNTQGNTHMTNGNTHMTNGNTYITNTHSTALTENKYAEGSKIVDKFVENKYFFEEDILKSKKKLQLTNKGLYSISKPEDALFITNILTQV